MAEDLQTQIDARTSRSVSVDVRFVEYQRAAAVGDDDGRSAWWPLEEWLPTSTSPSAAQSPPQVAALPADLIE